MDLRAAPPAPTGAMVDDAVVRFTKVVELERGLLCESIKKLEHDLEEAGTELGMQEEELVVWEERLQQIQVANETKLRLAKVQLERKRLRGAQEGRRARGARGGAPALGLITEGDEGSDEEEPEEEAVAQKAEEVPPADWPPGSGSGGGGGGGGAGGGARLAELVEDVNLLTGKVVGELAVLRMYWQELAESLGEAAAEPAPRLHVATAADRALPPAENPSIRAHARSVRDVGTAQAQQSQQTGVSLRRGQALGICLRAMEELLERLVEREGKWGDADRARDSMRPGAGLLRAQALGLHPHAFELVVERLLVTEPAEDASADVCQWRAQARILCTRALEEALDSLLVREEVRSSAQLGAGLRRARAHGLHTSALEESLERLMGPEEAARAPLAAGPRPLAREDGAVRWVVAPTAASASHHGGGVGGSGIHHGGTSVASTSAVPQPPPPIVVTTTTQRRFTAPPVQAAYATPLGQPVAPAPSWRAVAKGSSLCLRLAGQPSVVSAGGHAGLAAPSSSAWWTAPSTAEAGLGAPPPGQ